MNVKLDRVTFFHPESETPTIDQLSLELNKGDFVLLIGPSGCGKSTLLQIIAGVIPHLTGGRIRGSVLLDKEDILRNPKLARGVVGLTLQDPEAQLTSLYVEDEIAFGPENLLLPRETVLDRMKWVVKRARLSGLEKSFVYALSGGQKQRVAIAAGLSLKPKILLMDGPTTNLDPQGAGEVLRLISELKSEGDTETVVIAANKMDELLPLITRVVVMDRGTVVLDGSPESVLLAEVNRLESLGIFVPEQVLITSALERSGLFAEEAVDFPRTIQDTLHLVQRLNLREPSPKTNIPIDHGQPVVEIKDLHFGYGNNTIFRGLDLTIGKGESLAVVGQNGSGKTTLMSLVAGLNEPSKGIVLFEGVDTRKDPPVGKVGYVFQYPEHQFVATTVYEEISFGLKTLGYQPDQIERKVADILEEFGLFDLKDSPPYILSMGEKRLLSVATMIVLEPEVLILDEPTTGLDQKSTNKLMRLLNTFVNSKGMTLIQVSHDMEQVAEFSNRVVVLDNGQVIFDGSPRMLFVDDDVLKLARLDPPPAARLSKALWPGKHQIPIIVDEFLEEVKHASLGV